MNTNPDLRTPTAVRNSLPPAFRPPIEAVETRFKHPGLSIFAIAPEKLNNGCGIAETPAKTLRDLSVLIID